MTLQYDALLSDQSARTTPVSYELRTPSYASWLSELGIQRDSSPDASASSADSVSEAEFLYRQVPVLCLVQAKTRQQVRAVYNNWGRHCNRLVFFGSIQDPYVPVHQIPLSVADAQVTCLVLRHVLHKYGGEFSWVLLVDDETFAIVENLRFYVAPLNSSAVYYLGHPVQETSGGFYNSMAGGIVLSEGAVRSLSRTMGRRCDRLGKTSVAMDRYVGKLLLQGLSGGGPLRPGGHCCSRRAVTFHGVNPVEMFLFEYLAHQLQPPVKPGTVRQPPTNSPPNGAPMELSSVLSGKAFIRPFGIGKTTFFYDAVDHTKTRTSEPAFIYGKKLNVDSKSTRRNLKFNPLLMAHVHRVMTCNTPGEYSKKKRGGARLLSWQRTKHTTTLQSLLNHRHQDQL
ncbi:beta1,3-galactosyltransferase, putative [Ixodes scapularis]|uniref:Beta1,3-galactosyltransferase, putative n=1 Tax=Ixodes scapularis TaxID=6945 RepID=B7QNC6_IXOSC|nr:beta1,3-galactosyltransferase, putative [Ixodes scapularis]|eukprot:XP_002416431.1 beta1,3-galactosyltransferase, putative [Ixodes scapularis]